MLSKYISSARSSNESLLSSDGTMVGSTSSRNSACLRSEMESDFSELHRQLQRPGLSDLANQRVLLSENQKSRMDFAKLVTAVRRMGRGRLVKQEAPLSPSERRSQDMLDFMERMDRFNIPELSDRQRFMPRTIQA
ncbi:hypothetical protein H4R33_002313 [Dimargaris cristalligena]|uniref:Uncharacterized protein n=1 Tax=Dimargaris cristalligena TaxID=215637 RepID=A0A4V1J552_9FUNG|nr:hypothetical protein H4R33_002313 [Dimargaris cristalligena]RKP37849.1 hypothetical protein BJ085DRAFT_33236 [Dimargaris cristalligena]|eukprot:RKP37849.1 hypothetical protein BJ085DRAFT_33236 [Dimargaris cristalligena]